MSVGLLPTGFALLDKICLPLSLTYAGGKLKTIILMIVFFTVFIHLFYLLFPFIV